MKYLRCVSVAAALALLAPGLAADVAAATEFVVLGDMPYGPDQARTLEKEIGDKIEENKPLFVVHSGDIRAGYESCDGLRPKGRDYKPTTESQRDLIYGLYPGRVFYTPGDNDWTDCDRFGDKVLERLEEIRDLFFSEGSGYPNDPAFQITRQHAYPENAIWRANKLLFVTLHVVGSDNGRFEIKATDVDPILAEVEARDTANATWLSSAFLQAKDQSIAGLVLVMQADPGALEPYRWENGEKKPLDDEALLRKRLRACDETEPFECNAFLKLLRQLTDEARALDKPVLLVHGDTNRFCLDKSFGGWQAPKLQRLNGPGDYVTIDAAMVRFDETAADSFTVKGLFSEIAPPDCQGR